MDKMDKIIDNIDSLDNTIALFRHDTLLCELYKKGWYNPMDIYYHDFLKNLNLINVYSTLNDSVKKRVTWKK